jgi:hypothetical protein
MTKSKYKKQLIGDEFIIRSKNDDILMLWKLGDMQMHYITFFIKNVQKDINEVSKHVKRKRIRD